MATRNDYLHCRMDPEDMVKLDAIVKHHNLKTRTKGVEYLIGAEFNKLERAASRMKPREQSPESAE